MRIPLGSIGLAPGQPGYDPQHPWYLPDAMHTDYECKAIAQQVAEGTRNAEDLCVFAFHSGTPPYDYVRPASVPSVSQIAIDLPGDVLGGGAESVSHAVGKTASGVGDGLFSGLSTTGILVLGGLGVVTLVLLLTASAGYGYGQSR